MLGYNLVAICVFLALAVELQAMAGIASLRRTAEAATHSRVERMLQSLTRDAESSADVVGLCRALTGNSRACQAVSAVVDDFDKFACTHPRLMQASAREDELVPSAKPATCGRRFRAGALQSNLDTSEYVDQLSELLARHAPLSSPGVAAAVEKIVAAVYPSEPRRSHQLVRRTLPRRKAIGEGIWLVEQTPTDEQAETETKTSDWGEVLQTLSGAQRPAAVGGPKSVPVWSLIPILDLLRIILLAIFTVPVSIALSTVLVPVQLCAIYLGLVFYRWLFTGPADPVPRVRHS